MANETKALAIIPRTVDEVRTLSTMLSKSGLLPQEMRGNEANVAMSILAGQEMGLPPMAAIRGVHIVKGKPVLSADTMVGVVLGSGLAEYFVCIEESSTSVTYETQRRGSPRSSKCTWTMEDAKRAGLNGDNWSKYPRAMLKARCKAMLARDVYPDVLAGCYDPDELPETQRTPRSSTGDVIDVQVVGETPTNGESTANHEALLQSIDDAPTLDELDALVPMLKTLSNGTKEEAKRRFGKRREALRNLQTAPATEPAA